MPIYEFICEDCFTEFEKLVGFKQSEIEINCPTCGSELIRKKISSFASLSGGERRTTGASSRASCDPTRST